MTSNLECQNYTPKECCHYQKIIYILFLCWGSSGTSKLTAHVIEDKKWNIAYSGNNLLAKKPLLQILWLLDEVARFATYSSLWKVLYDVGNYDICYKYLKYNKNAQVQDLVFLCYMQSLWGMAMMWCIVLRVLRISSILINHLHLPCGSKRKT